MRKILGTIGTTLAIVVVMATSAAPASAHWVPFESPAGGPYSASWMSATGDDQRPTRSR
jgi:hypothetical protein